MIQMQRATEMEANVGLESQCSLVWVRHVLPDQKYHNPTSKQSDKGGAPVEISEVGSEVRSRGEIQTETRYVDRTVREEVQH